MKSFFSNIDSTLFNLDGIIVMEGIFFINKKTFRKNDKVVQQALEEIYSLISAN